MQIFLSFQILQPKDIQSLLTGLLEKIFQNRIFDQNTLILPVVHTYQFLKTGPIDVQYKNLLQTNNPFELNMIDFYQNHQVDNTICSLQTSHKIDPLFFPPLLFSKVILHFLNTFHFQYFELIVSEYIEFCKKCCWE